MLADERWEVARRAGELAGRTSGRSGNLSVRAGDRFCITPSGVPYADIEPDDVPVVDLDGALLDGDRSPSSETPMHAAVYRALEPAAVVHAHTPWATTMAVRRDPVLPVHYALARAGGRVPVADYATYGTDELARNAVTALESTGTTACLLANHGVLAVGEDVDAAFETLDAVEFTARMLVQASATGVPVELPDDELERVAERFASYGQG